MPAPLTGPVSPEAFAKTWANDTLKPALTSAAGTDGKVSATEAAKAAAATSPAADNVKDVFEAAGYSRPAISTLVKAGEAVALAAAKAVAGSDGLVSASEAASMGERWSVDFNALVSTSTPLQFSENVLSSVMTKFNVADRAKLLAEAAKHDNGNGYLNRTELETAAKALSSAAGGAEHAVISDIDSTVIPAHATNAAVPNPYPGVAALYRALEGATAGDIHYVTARSPDRITDMPEYFDRHDLPNGTIDTGTSALPWVAEPEKIKDIAARFDAEPNKKFVLFGDNKHRDPEVYKEILRRYPDRVIAAFINDVKTVPPERTKGLTVIKNYAEAAAVLFKNGTIDEATARGVMKSAKAEGLDITEAQMNALLR